MHSHLRFHNAHEKQVALLSGYVNLLQKEQLVITNTLWIIEHLTQKNTYQNLTTTLHWEIAWLGKLP